MIRAMPNITSLALEGTTVYFSNDESEKVDQLIRDTLGLVSPFCERVASEELLDAATAVAGSGPAFVLLVVEALADAAVRSGFARGIAIRIATQTVLVYNRASEPYGFCKKIEEIHKDIFKQSNITLNN